MRGLQCRSSTKSNAEWVTDVHVAISEQPLGGLAEIFTQEIAFEENNSTLRWLQTKRRDPNLERGFVAASESVW